HQVGCHHAAQRYFRCRYSSNHQQSQSTLNVLHRYK
ncbi:hypothetical protein D030_5195B, partial [Vibrio parahaemolyticus AQ3810]